MNNRIPEIIEQSDFSKYNDLDDTYVVHRNELIDFARQVIQDCIVQCRGAGSAIDAIYSGEQARRFKSVSDNCERLIKLRFGVNT